MKFAINYSKPAEEFLSAGKIQFDLFKCPDWPELMDSVGSRFPMYYHFSLQAGKKKFRTTDLNQLEEWMEKTNTRNMNMHLGPDALEFDGMTDQSQSPQEVDLLYRTMLDDIAVVTDRFGADRVVLENCPWSTQPTYRIPAAVLHPELITKIVRETKSGLLLDIAHALIAAKWLKQDIYQYLDKLPVDTLKEIHVSGLKFLPIGLWTDHYAMRDEDWIVTAWVFERIKKGDWKMPEMVSFEYGGVGPRFEERTDAAMIAEQTPRLYEMVKSC
jgi:uncharacterized protein (UPF0276 family)